MFRDQLNQALYITETIFFQSYINLETVLVYTLKLGHLLNDLFLDSVHPKIKFSLKTLSFKNIQLYCPIELENINNRTKRL